MKIRRQDGIESNIELDNPPKMKHDTEHNVMWYHGHCIICKGCYLRSLGNGFWCCENGGPFNGYINMETGEITT